MRILVALKLAIHAAHLQIEHIWLFYANIGARFYTLCCYVKAQLMTANPKIALWTICAINLSSICNEGYQKMLQTTQTKQTSKLTLDREREKKSQRLAQNVIF